MIKWILKMINWILKKIIEWIKEHVFGVIIGAAAIGAGAGAAGAVNAHKAKKINKEARAIRQTALDKHDKAYKALQQNLSALGQIEKTSIDSFNLFANTIGRIQKRPQIKLPLLSRVKLPNYEPQELKQLSTDLETLLGTGVGAGAGALAGLAAFGATAVVAAPAMITAGVVLCVKGFGLKKKAVENKKQAQQMSKSVDEIVAFYTKLQQAADDYRGSISSVYNKYMQCLNKIIETLSQKDDWKKFTREEKKNVENTVLLARLLYQMCKTKIVVQHEDQEKLEDINEAELQGLQKDAQRLLATCT